MKLERCGSLRRWLLVWAVTFLAAAPEFSWAQTSQPVITSIRPQGTNVIVTIRVPAGVKRVALESRAHLGAGAWTPALVAQTDGAGGTLTLTLPLSRKTEMLRARADFNPPLPTSFYAGAKSFLGPPTNNVTVWAGVNGTGVPGGTPPTGGATREVVESDIWQLSGDTLYFFNQYRGLQVLDITNPDAAAVRGTLSLPAAGEQMYLAGPDHVVLLVRNGCGSSTDDSQVLLVSVTNDQPRVVKSLPVPGSIQESRMVGTALYVASQTFRPVAGTTNTTWEWGTLVASFDLADPDTPLSRNSLWYPGYGNVVAATDTYLFVVTQDPVDWWRSTVRFIDITDPDGTMAAYGSITLSGRVSDKFKLNYAAGIFTSISEDWHFNSGTRLVTRLETFDLPDPRSVGPGGIMKLGELELGQGERLHATRFDGNVVYVVTFFQIDPLWVVDLSDPVHPHVAGSVDVPGWSSYIQPLGNRLVTVGVESNRVAVSLFDVHDPAQPGLLSRVRLGQNYSWSEANSDEKAFSVLTDIGLILVPYNGDSTNGWTSQVQLIDLSATSLTARGIMEHQCQPRRAAFSHNRILSLSNWELLSVDAKDRDHPAVLGDTELAWPVDRLFMHGDYVLELATGMSWWGRSAESVVRVGSAALPNQVLGELSLGELPIVGSTIRDGRLYVAQGPAFGVYAYLINGPDPSGGSTTSLSNFVVTVIDLAALPQLTILGQVSTTVDLPAWGGGSWQALWPKPDVLVWAGGGYSYWPWCGPILLGGGPASFMPWPVGGAGGGELLAFDVSKLTEPKFVSEVNLLTNGWWGFSQPVSVGTLVYLSHNASEPVVSPTDPLKTWLQRSFLDVIDYADPLSPTLRKPVNIPGSLEGVSHFGELLYTTGYHWTTTTANDGTEWLDACAYDGVSAAQVASLALPNSWPHPLLVAGTNVFIGWPDYSSTNAAPHQLQVWTLPDTGKFTVLRSADLPMPVNTLITRGTLLAAGLTDQSVCLFDISPGLLLPIGHGKPAPCAYFDLNQADGSLARGLWLPLGMYGVAQLPRGN